MREAKEFAVYVMANTRRGVMYVGVTSALLSRVHQHRTDALGGFTTLYGLKRLVWYERHEEAATAIYREKQLKRWRRDWKFALIEETNPEWPDLWTDIGGNSASGDPGSRPG
jgi:putative endonuclease